MPHPRNSSSEASSLAAASSGKFDRRAKSDRVARRESDRTAPDRAWACNAVTARDFEFPGDQSTDHFSRKPFLVGEKTDLHMPASLAQRKTEFASVADAAECIERYVDAASRNDRELPVRRRAYRRVDHDRARRAAWRDASGSARISTAITRAPSAHGDHYGGEADAATTVDGDPLSGPDAALRTYGTIGGAQAAAH